MGREEIIELTANRFYNDFVTTAAARVLELGAVEELYTLATDNNLTLPTATKRKVMWRSAYILEYLYFNHNELFTPYEERFLEDFTLCKNYSARRSFAKMMVDILKRHTLRVEQMESIAQTTAEWIADPKTKVAVIVWAMSILKSLRPHVAWVDDMWEDMEGIATKNLTPAILTRLKRGWE